MHQKDATVFFDQERNINFYTFSRNGYNAVLHQKDNVTCILVSKMPTEELLDLARSSVSIFRPEEKIQARTRIAVRVGAAVRLKQTASFGWSLPLENRGESRFFEQKNHEPSYQN